MTNEPRWGLVRQDTVRCAVFCDESVCLGFKREYQLVHTQLGTVTELFPVGRDGIPVAVVLPTKEILLTQDNIGIFIGFNGSPTRKYGLTWPEAPTMLALSYPYVLAANSKHLDTRTIASQKQADQTAQLRGVQCLVVESRTSGGGTSGSVFVSSSGQSGKSQLHLLRPTPIMQQIDTLMDDGLFTEARQHPMAPISAANLPHLPLPL